MDHCSASLTSALYVCSQGDNAHITTPEPLEAAAHAFGIEPELLSLSLTTTKIQSAGRASISMKTLTPEESAANRDTLAKEAYKRIFEFIVFKVNSTIDVASADLGSISKSFLNMGILDM